MHRVASRRWLGRALSTESSPLSNSVPLFLCPALARARGSAGRSPLGNNPIRVSAKAARPLGQRRHNHTDALASEPATSVESRTVDSAAGETLQALEARLPVTCHGCGAFSQSSDARMLGFFSPDAKRVRDWVYGRGKWGEKTVSDGKEDQARRENKVIDDLVATLSPDKLKELGLDPDLLRGEETKLEDAGPVPEPVCDRCHDLAHNYGTTAATTGVPVFHPTVEALRETIEESPHKYNHIYHVIDAADFPMSLLPRLNVLLGDIPLRTKNRRSRSGKYVKDKQTEMSFIITRTDLLGPKKEIVDSMMPWMRSVLSSALGRLGNRVRLGNVVAVSAKREWWTKPLKEQIWKRGGAGWLVGKFNVGKSALFEVIYPKGRLGNWSAKTGRDVEALEQPTAEPEEVRNTMDYGDLLPPAQPAQMYPGMPLVSTLPGTTASPIRVPFGNGKGELIDLPGMERSNLEQFVTEKHRRKGLLMTQRIVPEQVSLEEGRSLLLGGGLIQIMPKTPGLTFLAYNFTPLPEHLTSNWKATEFIQGERNFTRDVDNWATREAREKMKLAKTVPLKFDVTKLRAGPLTTKQAAALKVDQLPFRVLSADILIEGVGYVEVVAQVRAKQYKAMMARQAREDALASVKEEEEEMERKYGRENRDQYLAKKAVEQTKPVDPFAAMAEERMDGKTSPKAPLKVEPEPEPEPENYQDAMAEWPTVEVYAPEGRFIDYRQPLQGWMHNKPLVKAKHRKSRPRPSMKGAKKLEKARSRARSGAGFSSAFAGRVQA